MTDLFAESLASTATIAARVGVHPRACAAGATARDGSHIRLDHVRTPGRIRTSIAAVERFLAAFPFAVRQTDDDIGTIRGFLAGKFREANGFGDRLDGPRCCNYNRISHSTGAASAAVGCPLSLGIEGESSSGQSRD